MSAAIIIALGLVVALLSVLVIGLLRSHAEILKALHDLGVNLEHGHEAGDRPSRTITSSAHAPRRTGPGVAPARGEEEPFGPAHDITGTLASGGAAHIAVTGTSHATVLAFLSTGCGTCGVFWEALSRPDGIELPGADTRLVIVTNGPDAESPAAVAELAPSGAVTVMSGEAWDDYNVPVSPYFVLVDGPSARVIGEGAGTSWEQVADLLRRSVADARVAADTRPKPDLTRMSGQDRSDFVDAELHAAGILPGDPSLYPAPHPDAVGDQRP
ncbi:MAG: hypothetical protein ACO1PW_06450 [Actinomycetota bacterium]